MQMTTIIPIPMLFYDVKAAAKPYSLSNIAVCLLSTLLYLFTIGAFVGTFTFYTSPSQRFTTETIVYDTLGHYFTNFTEGVHAPLAPRTRAIVLALPRSISTMAAKAMYL